MSNGFIVANGQTVSTASSDAVIERAMLDIPVEEVRRMIDAGETDSRHIRTTFITNFEPWMVQALEGCTIEMRGSSAVVSQPPHMVKYLLRRAVHGAM